MNIILRIYFFAFLKRLFKSLYFLRLISNRQDRNLRRSLIRHGEVQTFVTDIGMPMILNATDVGVSHAIILKGSYELPEVEIFKKIIHEGNVFIDVGANLGYYTLFAAKMVGSKGKVFAFEPDPYNFSVLKKNISLNSLSNVNCYNKAVAKENGTLELYLSFDLLGDHNIIYNPNREVIPVKKVALDSVLKDSKVDIVKIDIQGGEEFVLEGLKKTITKNKNIVIMTEFCPTLIKASGLKPENLAKILINLGLKGYVYTSSGSICLKDKQSILEEAEKRLSINIFLQHKNSQIDLSRLQNII